MNEELGLSSDRAFDRLFDEAKSTVAEWYSVNVVNKLKPTSPNKIRTFSRFFCTRTFIFIRVSLVFLIVGSADIDNNIDYSSVSIYSVLLLYTIFLEVWQNRIRASLCQLKYRNAIEEIEDLEKNRPNVYTYHTNPESVTDDVAICQTCIRDGIAVEVPRLLLVKGDVILFRPGQTAPCECETFDGRTLLEGEKIDWKMKIDPDTDVVHSLEPIKARVTSFPIKTHLDVTLSSEDIPLQFDYQLQYMIHQIFEHYIIPSAVILSTLGTLFRFLYSDNDSLFGTRFSFAVPSLTILPLLIIQLPLLLNFVRNVNNRTVFQYLEQEPSESYKDLVSVFASITGTSFVDKKGILSSAHPSIEKVVFATDRKESGEIDQQQHLDDIHLEVVNLTSEQSSDSSIWNLYIDDPNWQRFFTNLLPLSQNLLLNSCKQSEHFHKFLDHLSVVALTVPRTIATAIRRCMCQLPALMGFTEQSLELFNLKSPKIIGIYKRQPGEAPLPGLTKHRTPMEMAFCTIHEHSRSLHSHMSCQGTANLVADGCTHIWNGSHVVPMSKRLTASVKDFYQRHSMTGHCLAVSYKPILQKIDDSVNGKFIEIPLNQEMNWVDLSTARSHSIDSLETVEEIAKKVLKTADDVIEECFTGNILCGLVVLQYEALPQAVSIIEKLDSICVRPVYFSKENELRSRVFAEKLGIEAGWNCHISLADEEPTTKKLDIAHEQFVKQKPRKPKIWNRFALSSSDLESLDCESLIRGSPSLRKMSMMSGKVEPIPNIARLPTGVKSVRPHLEEVDNVPLLVGLFTDSTTFAVEEMIDIFQENGEVVMVVGSSKNIHNTMLFSKSNLSICVDGIEETACRVFEEKSQSNVNEISTRLICLSADFRLNHQKLSKISALINCSRHRMTSFRHSLLFLLYSSILVSVSMLISTYFLLPILFTHSQVIFTSIIHIPILFLGTLFTSFEPKNNIIRIAPKNTDEISKIEKLKIVTTFFMQFLPTAGYINTVFFFLLISNSNLMCSFSDISCIFNTDGSIGSKLLNETHYYSSLSTDTVRHIMGLQLTTCLCVLSSSFVFGLSSLWVENPFKCISWVVSISICFITQIGYSYLRGVHLSDLFSLLPIIALLIWVVVITIINELIKIRRIGQFTREQRRTKFDFDTKLGMNSPY